MADSSIQKLFAYYYSKLRAFFKTKDVLSFLLFLMLSACFWFVNSLDKERETQIYIPVEFSGIPQNIAVTNTLPTQITVLIKDQGINLLGYSRRNGNPIIFEAGNVFYEKGKIIFGTDQIRGRLSRYFSPTTQIMGIKPDSLVLQYEKLSSKVLPVELDAEFEFAQQYTLSEKVNLSPAQVTVFGPQRLLEKLDKVHTEKLVLKNISDTVVKTCNLKRINGVRFANYETKVTVYAEMFTEKKMVLPVVIINCPKDQVIRTFPAFVDAVFNVSLTHFNAIKPDDLKVTIDYSELNDNTTKYRLKIQNFTTYITNIRIEPEEVEYIREVK